MTTIVELQDGRIFPTFQGETLAWDIGLYTTLNEERAGYPRARAVIAAMRIYRPSQLEQERKKSLKASFDRVFGHNAAKLLVLLGED